MEEIRTYMETYFPENYKRFLTVLEKIESESLRSSLEEYYLTQVKETYHFDRDYTRGFTIHLCSYINEINSQEIEHYLEYCLEYHKEKFTEIFYTIYEMMSRTNMALKNICEFYLRYSGKQDKKKLFISLYSVVPTYEEEDINQAIEAIIEIEKQHILTCYDLAKEKKTFCDSCVTMCWVKNEKGLYKRTTPFRYS